MKEIKIFTLNDFDSINIEFNKKEKNILSLLNECKLNNKTVFVNNRFSFGNKRLYPTITLCYLENSNNLKLKKNSFVSIFEMKKYIGYYSSTKSIINELLNKESILYKHKIFNTKDYYRFKDSFFFVNKQKINKDLYLNYSEDKLKILKKSFNNKFVIGIGYNLNVNTFPDSLIYALDELNRENIKVNLYIFNEKNNITNEQKIILNSKPFIKQFQVKQSHKLNYLRLCNMLASTCHDYLNEIGTSMVIDEYLLCDKPIICSYGKEREEQLGKDYPGFYNCKTCYTVPPMMWTTSYLNNKTNYDYLQRKFFKHKYIDKLNEILRIKQIIQNNLNYKKIIIEKSIFESININILLHCHSILDNMSGDTIMIINFIKKMLVNNNVSFITKYDPSIIYKNIKDKSKLRVIKTNDIMSNIDELSNTHDVIILRNGKLINKLIDKPYLNKTIIYGLDSNINELQSLQNSFLNIITQSQQLKDFFIENGIEENKIIIQEPIAKKYDFDLPERTDNEIRLIYCGTLRDEENILEIIKEFQKIHKERPEVVLKIVYGKIKGDIEFEKKIKNIIKRGVKGIVFKHDLSHKDACYEIATSDIGICWRKPGWGDNGEISTKVKEYEMYGLAIIKSNIFLNYDIIMTIKKIDFIKNIYLNKFLDSILEIKLNYNFNTKLYPYVLHNCFPYDYGGYATRTHNILNNFNKMYKDKKYFALGRIGYPYDIHSKSQDEIDYIKKIDNVFYLIFPNTKKKNYNILLDLLFYFFKIKTFHVPSAYKNALPIINYCNNKNIKSIYEVRGMWHITGISRHMVYNTKYNNKWLETYNLNEKYCIENCTIPLFITNQLQEYAINKTKYNILESLNCDIEKHPIFWNCFEINEKIKKEKTDKFIIGYVGSIVFYEGIIETILSIEKFISKHKKSIEFHLVGDWQKIVVEVIKFKNENISSIFKKPFIKLYGIVPHIEVINIISKFDLYIIPRLDLPVTNIVSPIKPFEPMSLKIPLLMSDCDCLKDISKNGENCMLFKKGDFDDFNEKIKYIIDNGYPENILENGYNFVKNERNWKFMIEHIGLYDMLD